jgi:hypothetical protein
MVPILMHRSKEVWGEDAEEFKLDRWLDGLSDQQREAYMAFSAGPRMVSGLWRLSLFRPSAWMDTEGTQRRGFS